MDWRGWWWAGCVGSAGAAVAGIALGAQGPLVVDAGTIAGREVRLDSAGKLLPWPVAEDTGYLVFGLLFVAVDC